MNEFKQTSCESLKNVCLRVITRKVFDYCLEQVSKFNNEIWEKKFHHKCSYHNTFHITSTIQAAITLFVAAVENRDDPLDPLDILVNLESWNSSNPSSQVESHELFNLLIIAFSVHDLGNIMNDSLHFLQEGYQEKGAEARSAAIAESFLRKYLEKEEADRLIPFVKHLIMQTTYDGDLSLPFAQVMRVVDQVGGALMLTDGQRLQSQFGLYLEMKHVGNLPRNLGRFFNFLHYRFKELVSNDQVREALLERVWRKQLPEKMTDDQIKDIEATMQRS